MPPPAAPGTDNDVKLPIGMFPASAMHPGVLIPLLTILLAASSPAQTHRFTISGTVKNGETGEALIGATLQVKELKGTGASTNAYGFFSLTIPAGRYTVTVNYIGFRSLADTVTLDRDLARNYSLAPNPVMMEAVVVTGERSNANVTSTEMGANKLQVREVQSLPVLLGERDILKTIQLLPGVKAAGEGNTGYYARGGNVDQNLIVLDEAPVYNSSHLLGFVSVFNSDAIKDVTVMTGSIPAEYGGRLSSVLDIRTNDGNDREYSAAGGLGLVASRITLQGPIVPETGSFIINGRRTYADMFLRLSSDTTVNRTSLYFYDLNAKANYRFGESDRVFLSGYFGRDNFRYPDVFGFNWGNTTATLRWNHIFDNKFFSNTSLIFSDYEYTNMIGAGTSEYDISSGITDLNLKTDFQYFIGSGSTLSFGLNTIHHSFNPGTITAGPTSTTHLLTIGKRYAWESAAYLSHKLEITRNLSAEYGLRFSLFSLMGPADVKTYDAEGDAIDSASYSSGQFIKTYSSLEPRVTLTYLIDDGSSVKASYTRTSQYLHLLSNATVSTPSDLWIPSTNNVPPQHADQYSTGYFRNFLDNEYETSVEFYYKNMLDLIDYRNGADLLLNPAVESQLLYGRGWSYGMELLVKKKYGAFTGWIGYTLSKTEEQFADVNRGAPFPARQDRTHDISVVGIWNYSPTWTFAAAWVYNTGNAVTYPSGSYFIDGRIVPYYTERNGYRMPAYHRLDLSATWTLGEKTSLNFSIYNAYNRMNAYAIYFRQSKTDITKTEAVKVTLFPFIPSISYNFKF